jgi:hypothetical protein
MQSSTNPDACSFLPYLRTAQTERTAVVGEPLTSLPQFLGANDNVYHYKKRIHKALKRNQNWLNLNTNDDVVYQTFYTDAENKNFGKFNLVDEKVEQDSVALAVQKNTAIADSGLIENNLKTVNAIYLNSFANNRFNFTPTEYNTLYNIATQIPLNAGFEAVYRARALLDLYIDDDASGSNGQRVDLSNEEIVTSLNLIQLYPNPASNNITISKLSENDGEITLFDALGKIVLTKIINAESNNVISVTNLPNGFYFYLFKENSSEEKQSGKLTVEH